MSSSLFRREWLEGDKYPRVFAYYFRQWADYTMSFHTHQSVEIMYVLSGECCIEIGGAPAERSGGEAGDWTDDRADADAANLLSSKPASSGTALTRHEDIRGYRLKKGQFMLLDGKVPHRLIVQETGPCRMLNVEFDMVEKETALPSLRELADEDEAVGELAGEAASHLVLSDSDELYPLLKSLVTELSEGENRRGVRVLLLFAQLLVTIAHLRKEMLAKGDDPAGRYVSDAIRYMRQNYDRDIQVKDIAAAVNLHPGYLHRLFGAATDTTITAYLTELRIDKAMMLLRQTDIPINDICEYTGIGSRAYFHALFRKHTGITPVEYRKSHHVQSEYGKKLF